MRSSLLALFLALAAATAQGTQTLTRDGVTTPGSLGAPAVGRPVGLVNDGSFEFGVCDWGSAWTCTTNVPSCGSWILDPLPFWGYPAYDGVHAAWLGGFCDGVPNSNSFCQDLTADSGWPAWLLDWAFMGWVNSSCGVVRITVDGEEVWQHTMQPMDHTVGTWRSASDLGGPVGFHTYYGEPFRLCFEWEACPDGVDNDNMLIDYVTIQYWIWDVATAASSFSVVKSLY